MLRIIHSSTIDAIGPIGGCGGACKPMLKPTPNRCSLWSGTDLVKIALIPSSQKAWGRTVTYSFTTRHRPHWIAHVKPYHWMITVVLQERVVLTPATPLEYYEYTSYGETRHSNFDVLSSWIWWDSPFLRKVLFKEIILIRVPRYRCLQRRNLGRGIFWEVDGGRSRKVCHTNHASWSDDFWFCRIANLLEPSEPIDNHCRNAQ